MGAEVLMKPVAGHRRRADHAHRLISLFFHLIAPTRLPRLHSEVVGPGAAITFAFDANQNCARSVLVRLGILPGFVLCDLHVKVCAGHVRLDAPEVEGAPVVRGQLASENIGDDVGPAHGKTAHGIGVNILDGPEVIVGSVEAREKIIAAVHDKLGVANEIDDVRRSRGGQQ